MAEQPPLLIVGGQDETGKDCGGSTCSTRCSAGSGCSADADCSDELCENSVCSAATCSDGQKNGDETGVDCGGLCSLSYNETGTGRCVSGEGCSAESECISALCIDKVCVEQTCTNGAKDGYETDVDCGGGKCVPCDKYSYCSIDTDCAKGSECRGSSSDPTLKCFEKATCSDDTKNQDETDVDCGGGCGLCREGEQCGASADCLTNMCTSGECTASCADLVQNQDETDADCGGTVCPRCNNTRTCQADSDCKSGSLCKCSDDLLGVTSCTCKNQGAQDELFALGDSITASASSGSLNLGYESLGMSMTLPEPAEAAKPQGNLTGDIHEVSISGDPSSVTGTFSLDFNGASTAAIAFSDAASSAAWLRENIANLTTVGDVWINVTDAGSAGTGTALRFTIEFLPLAAAPYPPSNVGDLPLVSIDSSRLSGANGASVTKLRSGEEPEGYRLAKQDFALLQPDTLTGDFKLSYQGFSTAALAPTASASDVQSALIALATIGEVEVYKTVHSTNVTWRVVFLHTGGVTGQTPHLGKASKIGVDATNLARSRRRRLTSTDIYVVVDLEVGTTPNDAIVTNASDVEVKPYDRLNLCNDSIKNGNETGADCGDQLCIASLGSFALCPVGSECTEPSQCTSGLCPAGLCTMPPVNCSVTAWDAWSQCTASCGGGTYSRSRTVVEEAKYGGRSCPSLFQEAECNTQECAVDCKMSEWAATTACTANCSGGVKNYTRTVQVEAAFGGTPCGELTKEEECNTNLCPGDCPEGFYRTCTDACTGVTADDCVVCAARSTSSAGSSSSAACRCEAGYTLSSGTTAAAGGCTACAIGFYKERVPGGSDAACSACPNDATTAQIGSNSSEVGAPQRVLGGARRVASLLLWYEQPGRAWESTCCRSAVINIARRTGEAWRTPLPPHPVAQGATVRDVGTNHYGECSGRMHPPSDEQCVVAYSLALHCWRHSTGQRMSKWFLAGTRKLLQQQPLT
ncbi:hypothetical protein CYMTET_39560 [Cymbomonas tetramitiformis]|uniref:Spondin-like TSP1 domain-containing protein n=1 Tax=Cymbomonas tetramitiformis TaxID=36881 RepID=A0AAE0CB80_9CHLO|nr:hypothetical protein CYMTET_39560 [Cymbomonas tetramitiformis]